MNNIFESAQENYYAIQPGDYSCEVCNYSHYYRESNEVIEFYVKYVDGNVKKNITVLYVFSPRSKSITMNELLAVLYPFCPYLDDKVLLSKLYTDSSMLEAMCSNLIGKCLTLKVQYNMRNGSLFKALRLKI